MLLSGMLFPVFLALVPLFNLVNQLKMSTPSVIDYSLHRLFSSLHNFCLTGFFKTHPTEIEESAIMDGANPYQVFSR